MSERRSLTLDPAGLPVEQVESGSPAERAGVRSGDRIVAVDGVPVRDVVDFRYYSSEEQFELTLRRDGRKRTVLVEREWGEEVGIRFAFELADGIHTCENKCVFCFIHQMPKGMRKSLYLMDDDYRLSFLHGHYVTLTNLSEEEFERIKEQRLSPIHVSVHAVDPALRGYLLGREQPEPVLPLLKDLIAHGIQIHAQVVLCPGLNDGAALEETVRTLADLYPGVQSVAVVPVGLSKFRHNLYPIRRVNAEYSRKILEHLSGLRVELKTKLGTAFVFPSDEWFFYAGRRIPARKWYEDFPQLEDGVGTCRLFLDEAHAGFRHVRRKGWFLMHDVTLVTAPLARRVIEWFAGRLMNVTGLRCRVLSVENDFFGRGITVAGLITAQDLSRSLLEAGVTGTVLVPDIALNDDQRFVDDLSLEDVRRQTNTNLLACPTRAGDFLRAFLPKLPQLLEQG
jgi:putative radical SAM enzyme (TIGR03279 family)